MRENRIQIWVRLCVPSVHDAERQPITENLRSTERQAHGPVIVATYFFQNDDCSISPAK
jgi:hypothetical protein